LLAFRSPLFFEIQVLLRKNLKRYKEFFIPGLPVSSFFWLHGLLKLSSLVLRPFNFETSSVEESYRLQEDFDQLVFEGMSGVTLRTYNSGQSNLFKLLIGPESIIESIFH
jgi:hypothetical protein